jgi:acyl carrier protein
MKDQIFAILLKVTPKADGYSGEHLIDDLGMDSLDIMNLVAELENAFSVEFEVDDIDPENFATLDTVTALVERRLNQ